MTDKLNAMNKLVEAVEVGDEDVNWFPISGHSAAKWGYCQRAHEGSLDAALALHEALLPGWKYSLSNDLLQHGGPCEPAAVWKGMDCYSGGFADETIIRPARAWLLAVLRAYRSMQG